MKGGGSKGFSVGEGGDNSHNCTDIGDKSDINKYLHIIIYMHIIICMYMHVLHVCAMKGGGEQGSQLGEEGDSSHNGTDFGNKSINKQRIYRCR